MRRQERGVPVGRRRHTTCERGDALVFPVALLSVLLEDSQPMKSMKSCMRPFVAFRFLVLV